jgi:phage shock protein C
MTENLPQRLSYDKLVGGVLGGVARYFGIDTKALRVIYAVGLAIGPFQLELFILYLVLWVALPKQQMFND